MSRGSHNKGRNKANLSNNKHCQDNVQAEWMAEEFAQQHPPGGTLYFQELRLKHCSINSWFTLLTAKFLVELKLSLVTVMTGVNVENWQLIKAID